MIKGKYKYTLLSEKKNPRNKTLQNISYKRIGFYIIFFIVFIHYTAKNIKLNIFPQNEPLKIYTKTGEATQFTDFLISNLSETTESIVNSTITDLFTTVASVNNNTSDNRPINTMIVNNTGLSSSISPTSTTAASFMKIFSTTLTFTQSTSLSKPAANSTLSHFIYKKEEFASTISKTKPTTKTAEPTISPTFSTKFATPKLTLLLNSTTTLSPKHQNRNQTNITKIPKSIKPVKYYVKTPHCKMPWVDPFTPAIRKMFKPEKYKDCSKDKPLVKSSFDTQQQRYILHINYFDEEDTHCCYQEIMRSGSGAGADKNYKLLPCANFLQDFIVPIHVDAMIVKCTSKKSNKTLQTDAFSFIQERELKETVANTTKTVEKERPPNVLLIGIDSISRFNFRRNMPKTFTFLEKNKWFELEGYNKVGDNTFPNLMALLVGLNATTGYSKCKPTTVGGLDNCEFIWKKYKAHGYRTAYAEDTSSISTFTYLKKGFKQPPTDYYLRPMMLAIEKEMKTVVKSGLNFCVGRKHSAEYVYDFGLEFANRYREKSVFGLFWTNSFSHNSYSTSARMDVRMAQYLEKINNDGIANRSIILFFSDHGCRWGPLLNLPEGFLEERLPMFFIWLPKWFQAKYPAFVEALQINKNRLTTPFDIHQTLKHILNLGVPTADEIETLSSCPSAQSLFHEVSDARTCESACIPTHWCTCEPYEIISTKNAVVKKAASLLVDEINNYLAINNYTTLCSTLKINAIKDAQLKIEDGEHSLLNETIRLKFITTPKDAHFQATVLYDMKVEKIHVIVENISRLDSYEKHAKCINEKSAKKFCVCKK